MAKGWKIALILLAVLTVLAIAAGAGAFYVYGYRIPFEEAWSTMPQPPKMVLRQQENGSVELSWPAAEKADRYLLQILEDTGLVDEEGNKVYREHYQNYLTDQTWDILPRLPEDQELTIRVSTMVDYYFPFEEEPRTRMGEEYMEITDVFFPPEITQLSWEADHETKQVDLQFFLPEGAQACLYRVEETGNRLITTLTEDHYTLQFAEDGELAVPEYDAPYEFAMDLMRVGEGYTYYGLISESFRVYREDMLGTVLELTTEEISPNQFCFSWNETKGEYYELQQYNPSKKNWTPLARVERDGYRSYTTGHLDRYSEFTFRVVALGDATLPDSEFTATPAESTVTTGASVVYSLIWPIQKLDIYADTDRAQVVGQAPAAKGYCVLDYRDGMFKIRYDAKAYGYIDANYCMINLPDLMGDKLMYNITNSYASIYMTHEYEIPTITNQITVGYEKVKLKENTYLVPLLFPTAKKLEVAAFDAIDKGYKLLIYDSYRPQEATRMLYDTTLALVDTPIPELPFTDKVLEDMPVLGEGEVLTYGDLITDNGRYTLNYFLAKGGSRHNQGIALDLTLYHLKTREEVLMQTSIHDLTWYSERKRNNREANILSKIMTDAGFGTLTSEWWHYQDNEAKDELKPAFMWSGVTPERWAKDDNGWRCFLANGKRYYLCTKTIGGVSYTFDDQGYVLDENGQRAQDI